MPNDSRDKSRERIDQHNRSYASIREHIVANANLLIDFFLNHPFIHTLIMTTQQDKVLKLGKSLALGSSQLGPLRREVDHMRFSSFDAADRFCYRESGKNHPR